MNPTRRTVLLAGAAAALLPALPGLPAVAATEAAATAAPPYASYWYPDSLPSGTPAPASPGVVSRHGAPPPTPTWRSTRRPCRSPPASHRRRPTRPPVAARPVSSPRLLRPDVEQPAQGAATADYYALTHWAYLDELVFWGGSAGEGLILAPNAPIVDAAHRHGVPVLGNVFLPPVAYGGQLQWTRDLVQKDSTGHYPLAAQLVAVAAAYGFDGWFINAETSGGNTALATAMLGFMNELKSLGTAQGSVSPGTTR